MRFFLTEIVARIVAIYLCIDSGRTLWHGLAGRRIETFTPDFLNRFMDWMTGQTVIDRDAAPVRYWIEVGIHAGILAACLFVAIFGWWLPDT